MTITDLNINDYKILASIVDKTDNRGLSKGRGSTKKQLIEKTGFSGVKISNTLKILLALELIDYAVKHVRANSYCITKKGIDLLTEMQKNII